MDAQLCWSEQRKKATHQNAFLSVLTPHSLPPHVESALMDMK